MECGNINGDCSCKEGFTGLKCDECLPNVIGDNCDTCQETFFNFPLCQEDCQCNPDGSTGLDCDNNGNCFCKEGYQGMKCDECQPNYIGDKCDACQPNFFDYPSCHDGLSK